MKQKPQRTVYCALLFIDLLSLTTLWRSCLDNPSPSAREGIAHSGLDPPTLIINQANAPKAFNACQANGGNSSADYLITQDLVK